MLEKSLAAIKQIIKGFKMRYCNKDQLAQIALETMLEKAQK